MGVTIEDISKKCGVSKATVSKVLNGYKEISPETKKLVFDEAQRLGYRVKKHKAGMSGGTKKSYNIGVVFSTLSKHGFRNEYFAFILEAFREEAAQRGYNITFAEQSVGRKSMTYLEHCIYSGFDGVCVMCADYDDIQVQELIKSGIPVAVVDRQEGSCISIMSDNEDGMRRLTGYIISKGYKKIAYIHGNNSAVTHNRLVGFYSTMEYNKIKVPEEYVLEGEYHNDVRAYELTQKLLGLENPPECIIAPDDYSALGVIRAVKQKKLNIPEDIAVAGYDGISVSKVIEPSLTTIVQDTDRIGREAAKLLIKLIENPRMTSISCKMLPVELYAGATVGTVNTGCKY